MALTVSALASFHVHHPRADLHSDGVPPLLWVHPDCLKDYHQR